MSEEWLDIVDADDVVIGRDTRDRIHRLGLMHRSAHIVLNDSHGRFMVQLRSRTKDTGAGLWDSSAAGHVDSGESYVACAARELREELGIIMAADSLYEIGRLGPEQRNGFEFTRIFRAQSDQPLTLQAEEVEDACWMTAAELTRWLGEEPGCFTQVFRVIWPVVQASMMSPGGASPVCGTAAS